MPAIVRTIQVCASIMRIDVIFGIDDEYIAAVVDRHLLRRVEDRMARVVIVAGITARTCAGHRLDDPVPNRRMLLP